MQSLAIKVVLFLAVISPHLYFGWLFWNIDAYMNGELNHQLSMYRPAFMLLSLLGALLYFFHLYRISDLDKKSKSHWALLFFLLNYFVFPFYWYKHVRSGKVT